MCERGPECVWSGGRWWSDQWERRGRRCSDWAGGRVDVFSFWLDIGSITDHTSSWVESVGARTPSHHTSVSKLGFQTRFYHKYHRAAH